MAAIYFIRHGQASFGHENYDQLSQRGCMQAQLLGQHWQQFGLPSKVYSGDLLRQVQTFEYFKKGLGNSDLASTFHSGFNEFNHVDVLNVFDPEWGTKLKALKQKVSEQDVLAQDQKTQQEFNSVNEGLQAIMMQALALWVSEASNSESRYQESWAMYKARCVNALKDAIGHHQLTAGNTVATGDDILVFSSAGTIAMMVQHVLGLSDDKTLALNQQIRNGSVTKLLFTGERISLDYFNNYSYLCAKGDDWVTFR